MKGLLLAVGDRALEALLASSEWHQYSAATRTVWLRRSRWRPYRLWRQGGDTATGDRTVSDATTEPLEVADIAPEGEYLSEGVSTERPASSIGSSHGPRPSGWPRSTAELSGRELLVLQLFAVGYSTEQAAQLTSLHSDEVYELTSRVCGRLGASNLADAIAILRRKGLIR
jgi:DNA-binding CsgD family transcriptional regulator